MPDGLGAFALLIAVIALALVLVLVWLLSRDKNVERTSFGLYVERRRYDELTENGSEVVTERQTWPKQEDR